MLKKVMSVVPVDKPAVHFHDTYGQSLSNILISLQALEENVKEKLSQFCHVPAANIITLYDVSNIWHIPLLLKDQKAHEAILKQLDLLGVSKEPILEEWTSRAQLCDMLHDPVRIAIVGKYTSLPDAYLSVLKVGLLNVDGYYNSLLSVIDKVVEE